ncbi:MAG: hypothetical protein EBR73_12195 [Rhodobacteraceae bacterium]|nr:hypothetical protein [Paracoccaceae bacterium]
MSATLEQRLRWLLAEMARLHPEHGARVVRLLDMLDRYDWPEGAIELHHGEPGAAGLGVVVVPVLVQGQQAELWLHRDRAVRRKTC